MIVRMLGTGAAEEAERYGGYPNGFLQLADEMNMLAGIHSAKGKNFSRANVAVLLTNYLQDETSPETDLLEQEQQLNKETEISPVQDDQADDSLQLGDSQQEDQPENRPNAGGVGSGT